jgi:hypothetical protein
VPPPSNNVGGGGGGGGGGGFLRPLFVAPLTPEMQKIVAEDKKSITNININVKTDPTKSTAQVGKDITKTLSDYLNNGGRSAAGGGGGVKFRPF